MSLYWRSFSKNLIYDAIHIGPFTIQYFYLVVLITFLFTYFIMDAFLTKTRLKQFIRNNYWVCVFIVFITYKFSVLFFRPQLIFTNNWIYLTGGTKGIYLGLLVCFLYLLWRMKKEKLGLKLLFLFIVVSVICFYFIYELVKIFILSLV